LDQVWTRYGPGLDQVWTRFGPGLDQVWTRYITRESDRTRERATTGNIECANERMGEREKVRTIEHAKERT
jgi:hypothetical protein